MVPYMKTYADIIDRWPSLRAFADDIGVPYGTAQLMRHRNGIAPRHWRRLEAAAQRRGISGVTVQLLSEIAEGDKDERPRPSRIRHKQRSNEAAA